MFIPFSTTRVFTVGAGTFTAYFNCSEFSGDVAVYDVLATDALHRIVDHQHGTAHVGPGT